MEVSKIKKALIDKSLTGNLYHKIDFSYNTNPAVFTTQKRF